MYSKSISLIVFCFAMVMVSNSFVARGVHRTFFMDPERSHMIAPQPSSHDTYSIKTFFMKNISLHIQHIRHSIAPNPSIDVLEISLIPSPSPSDTIAEAPL